MINWYSKYKEGKLEEAARIKAIQVANAETNRQLTTELNAELYTQSLQNVTFIESTIQTIMSSINSIKTRGSERNRIKKEFMQEQLQWYKLKLIEEKAMVDHYGVNKN